MDPAQGLLVLQGSVVRRAQLQIIIGHPEDLGLQGHLAIILLPQVAQEVQALAQALVGSQDLDGHLEDALETPLFRFTESLAAALPEDQLQRQGDLADLVEVAGEEDLLGDHRAEHLAHLPGQLSDLLAVLDLLVPPGGLVELHQEVQVGVVQFQAPTGGELLPLRARPALGLQKRDPLLEQLVHLDCELWDPAIQDQEVLPGQAERLHEIQGLDGGRAGLVDHQGHLAEALAWAQFGQDQLLPLAVADHVDVSLAQDVEGVPGVPLAHDHLAGLEALGLELLGQRAQNGSGKRVEQRIPGDEVGDLLTEGWG